MSIAIFECAFIAIPYHMLATSITTTTIRASNIAKTASTALISPASNLELVF